MVTGSTAGGGKNGETCYKASAIVLMRGALKANDLMQSKERFLRWNHRTLDFFFFFFNIEGTEEGI